MTTVEGDRPCPVCLDVAMEPELDYPYRYFECPECASCFDYVYVGQTDLDDPSCAIGVPETLRSRVSAAGTEQERQDQMRALASPEAVEARLRALPMFQPKET